MIQLSEDDVGGPLTGRPPDYEADARRRALEALSRPLDLGPVASEGEAAQALGDARRSTMPEPTRAGDMGMRPEDAIPPSQGGPASFAPEPPAAPAASAQPRPVAQLTEEDVGGPIVAPARPVAPSAQPMGMSAAPMASTPASAPAEAPGQPKDASRPRDPMQAEIDASRDAQRRRILAAVFGNIIRGIGGVATGTVVPLQDMPDVGQASEEEAAIRARHRTAAATKDREGREAAQATARQEREDAQRAEEMAFRREQLEVQRTRGTGGAPASPLQQAQADRIREEMALRAREQDPASRESEIQRSQYLATVDTLPQSMRARLSQAIPQDRLAGMSAAELRAPLARIQAFRERGTGGGSGNPAASAARAQTREQLVAEAEGAGISRAVAETMTPAQLARMMATAAVGSSQERQQRDRQEILPGVAATVAISQGEAQGIRNGFAAAREGYANIIALRDLGGSGVVGSLNPEQRASVVARLTAARGMVAVLGRTGIINPSEVPAINATVPNPSDIEQMTLGTLGARVRTFQGLLEDQIRSSLLARGVDDEGIDRAMGMLRTGRGAARPTAREAPEGSVRVRHPDGRTGVVPQAQMERARAAGFEVVDAP